MKTKKETKEALLKSVRQYAREVLPEVEGRKAEKIVKAIAEGKVPLKHVSEE